MTLPTDWIPFGRGVRAVVREGRVSMVVVEPEECPTLFIAGMTGQRVDVPSGATGNAAASGAPEPGRLTIVAL